MIRVLHVTPDDKFFDEVFSEWERDERIQNEAVIIAKNNDYQFRYIHTTDAVQILWNSEMVRTKLESNDYDVLFFHSLPSSYYKYFKFIPNDRIVIWWAWGSDIYGSYDNAFLSMKLYKTKTKKFVYFHKLKYNLKVKIYNCIHRNAINKLKTLVLERIDYFQPVEKIEYEMMAKHKAFKAKEFYYHHSVNQYEYCPTMPSNGNILLGNSATPTNNHLDCLNIIKKKKKQGQRIIIPVNYGDSLYREWLLNKVSGIDIYVIKNYLPRDEYFKIIDTCSYAVFGTIRQQAMGNIRYALSKGIKVFLYKESVAFASLKSLGFVVYAIEDINAESFTTPLTKEEIMQNVEASANEYHRRDNIYEECIDEIINMKKK